MFAKSGSTSLALRHWMSRMKYRAKSGASERGSELTH